MLNSTNSQTTGFPITEAQTQALDHIRFQLDLLRLTAVPAAMAGPSVLPNCVMQDYEDPKTRLAVEELKSTVATTVAILARR